ncbi:hypothetical protein NP493_265g03069 [Ridgeia piscesae]|uniref:Uncharacterized protein n=1 Tax=Ridgeia piscesae TaxID=27915 RepID=A0AAD9NXY3_RIDPI|nr:hypothetical protein NP493_265g03069 [Ridgeia piscesae]
MQVTQSHQSPQSMWA